MTAVIAWLSNGIIHLKDGDAEPRVLESKFGQTVRERAAKLAQKNAWKTVGMGARFMGAGMVPAQLERPGGVPVMVTGLSRAPEGGQLIYALQTDAVTGIFRLNLGSGEELRLFHGNSERVLQPAAHPEKNFIACAISVKGGAAHLGVIRRDGSELQSVTEGDSVDANPCWRSGGGNKLVYQSSGIGRDAAGNFLALGPASIQELDLDKSDLRCLVEEPDADLFRPRAAPDGSVYYLRRPRTVAGVSPFRMLLDLVLLPVRLLQAVFGYLNFFSARYTGKPLLTSGGARAKKADLRSMMIWNNLLHAQAAEEDDGKKRTAPSDWHLMRLPPQGEVERVAKGVSSFDVGVDGTVVFSDGAAIYRIEPAGPKKLFEANDVSDVLIVG